MEDNGNGPTRADAVRALHERGVDNANDLAEEFDAAEIVAACERWDRDGGGHVGRLVWRIRNGKFNDRPAAAGRDAQRRALFNGYAERYRVGMMAESHHDLIARRYPEELAGYCVGAMIVTDTIYPVISAKCTDCGFETGYPLRTLHVLRTPVHWASERFVADEADF
jgi:hypothetical protein